MTLPLLEAEVKKRRTVAYTKGGESIIYIPS
jgi:hypothetical protein